MRVIFIIDFCILIVLGLLENFCMFLNKSGVRLNMIVRVNIILMNCYFIC